MSPSTGAWAGRSASAKPPDAMIATRVICALPKAASVATTASVVLAGASRLSASVSASAAGAPPGRARRTPRRAHRRAAQKCGAVPRVARPTAFTATSAPTIKPREEVALAEPSPPFRS